VDSFIRSDVFFDKWQHEQNTQNQGDLRDENVTAFGRLFSCFSGLFECFAAF
jgi:hypothetical protein